MKHCTFILYNRLEEKEIRGKRENRKKEAKNLRVRNFMGVKGVKYFSDLFMWLIADHHFLAS